VDIQSAGHLLGRPVDDLKYIGEKEGGLDKLKGKTIGYIFFDGGYGREPIPLLEQFAKDTAST
jgi:branched-chain amino acid transport system substrate-binding protein